MSPSSPLARVTARALVESIPAAVIVLDEDACAVAVSPRAEELLGYARGELTGWPLDMVVVGPLGDGPTLVRGAVVRCRRKDGTDFLAEVEVAPLPGGAVLCTLSDADRTVSVADRLGALQRRLDLLTAVESACQSLDEPAELLGEICRVAVERGGFVLAWFALAGPDGVTLGPQAGFAGTYLDRAFAGAGGAGEDGMGVQAAGEGGMGVQAAGEDGMGVQAAGEDAMGEYRVGAELAGGPVPAEPAEEPLWRRALAEGKPVVGEPEGGSIGSWRAAARRAGYRSSAALPIVSGRDPVAAFELHAAEPDAFDDTELDILGLVAGRLAARLDGLSHRPR